MNSLFLLASAAVWVALAAEGVAAPPPAIGGEAAGSAISMNGKQAAIELGIWGAANAAADPGAWLVEYKRMEQCETSNGSIYPAEKPPCAGSDASVPLPDCGGFTPLLHLWRHTRPTPDPTPYGPWVKVADASCPQDLLPAFTAEDFRRLPLTPTTTTLQPGTANLLTGLGVAVTATHQPQELTTTLLDFPITVRATPTQYTWDFGDGSTPVVTTDPGATFPTDGRVIVGRYPDGVIGYPYPHLGTFTITLTTTWAGQYQVAGTTTWLPVTGTATTTTTHTPVTILESRTHLVAENCHQNPTGPGC